MKTIKYPRFNFVLLIFIFCCFQSSAQPPEFLQQVKPVNSDEPRSIFDCEKQYNIDGCNYIRNSEFIPNVNSNIVNPFPFSNINHWAETHGSPSLSDFLNPPSDPPSDFINYISMYSWSLEDRTSEGEGITQLIAPTIKEKQYSLSFFKKLAKYGDNDIDMDKFYIVLMHCEDYKNIHTYPLYTTPAIPKKSQLIYCESHLNNL